MSNDQSVPLVLALDDPAATLEQVGGKGASLARLAAVGLPIALLWQRMGCKSRYWRRSPPPPPTSPSRSKRHPARLAGCLHKEACPLSLPGQFARHMLPWAGTI